MENNIQLLQRGFIITAPNGGPLDVADVIDGVENAISVMQEILFAGYDDATIKTRIKQSLGEDDNFVNSIIPSLKTKISSIDLSSTSSVKKHSVQMSADALAVVSSILTTFIRRTGGLYYGKTVYLPDMKRLLYFAHSEGQGTDSWKEVWT